MKHLMITLEEYLAMNDSIKQMLCNDTTSLKVKYSDPDFPTLQISEKGNWIDLKCAEDYTLKAGEFAYINLGVAMKLPEGYEALLAPRSGTFGKYGLIQTNSVGVIDNSYSGNNDIWKMPVLAMKDTDIKKGERLCQFRLVPTMESLFVKNQIVSSMAIVGNDKLTIVIVDKLDDINRGGFGSTGR